MAALSLGLALPERPKIIAIQFGLQGVGVTIRIARSRGLASLWASNSNGSACLTRMMVQGPPWQPLIGTVATKRWVLRPCVAAPITIRLTWLPWRSPVKPGPHRPIPAHENEVCGRDAPAAAPIGAAW